jgi:hypothetical protein
MKEIIIILESGEEIFSGFATSLYKHLLFLYGGKYVPLNGNRDYTCIKNMYNPHHKQFVTYKAKD